MDDNQKPLQIQIIDKMLADPDEPESSQNPTPPARTKQTRTLRAQGAFLAAFGKSGMVSRAAVAAEIDRRTHYDWLREDSEYAEEFRRSEEIVIGACEDVLYERAVHGVQKAVTVAGARELVTEYDNRAAEFILRCRKPEVYGDRAQRTGETSTCADR